LSHFLSWFSVNGSAKLKGIQRGLGSKYNKLSSGGKGNGSSIKTNTWFGWLIKCFYSQQGFEQQSKLAQLRHFNRVDVMN